MRELVPYYAEGPDQPAYSAGSNGRFYGGSLSYNIPEMMLSWIDFPVLAEKAFTGIRIQNLHVTNIFSLVVWTALLFLQAFALKRPQLFHIAMLLFPVAALSVLVVQTLPGYHLVETGNSLGQLLHILMAVVTFSVLIIAGLQAVLVAMQDWSLKRKQPFPWHRSLPPLETMETMLHTLVFLGFIGLTVVLINSVLLMILGAYPRTITHSPHLAGIAWLLFLMILIRRHHAGWQRNTVIFWTILGIVILALSYFGIGLIRTGI